MPKSKNSIEKEEPPLFRIMSGATGGPSTGHGLTYQIDYAVWQSLILITKTLASPLENLQIVIEPRAVADANVTRWDIALQPEDVNIEAKINPNRKDVEEWLGHMFNASQGFPKRSFKLVYSEGGNPLLHAVKQMSRIADECAGDKDKFSLLVKGERIADSESVFEFLGENAYLILQRVRIDQIPEAALEEHVHTLARTIAGESGGDRLYRLLFDRFYHGVSKRTGFDVKQLVSEASQERISINYQPEITSSYYDPVISSALFLLQDCRDGLPIEVIAFAVGCDRKRLKEAAEELLQTGKIAEDDDTWVIHDLPSKLAHERGGEVVSRALEALLKYIEEHKKDERSLAQIDNALFLAEECVDEYPRSVVHLFPTLDKLVKRRGDVQLVLEIAQLSIHAGKRIKDRTRAEAEAVARCYVCGVSWAYQRMTGHLDDARNAYVDSRRIAEDIEAHLTLAFISKCLGRLCRIEAEQLELPREQKLAKLHESIALLEESIERFESLQDYPPHLKTHETGDSYSLLGRTYLVLGNIHKAKSAMARAFALIENTDSKEFADLLILNGDMAAKERDYPAAESTYNRALSIQIASGGLQQSEIRARILRQRGLNYKVSGKISQAKKDFEETASIWDDLDRPENAAAARWEVIFIENKLPTQLTQRLEKEASTVKVATAELYSQKMAERGRAKSHLSSRVQPDNNFVESLIKQARQQIAIQNLDE